ncbi:MAG TPA: DUF5009 domain-containing protein [Candidatus Limnocylindria bacterium]|jgi:predicted acyltransferase|nr:DUF5009 domain-containing protein [Candidatus Limnocylindria bacterium]
MAETELPAPAPVVEPARSPQTSRLLSLDALRGFDMFWIMGADSLGGALAALAAGPVTRGFARQLEHVEWQGFHFEDLIFPLFVFMAGVSLVFSLGKIIPRYGKDAAFARLMKRTLLLYLVGIFYYGGFSTSFQQIRLLGVLQRIALCYGATGFLFIFFKPRTLIAITAGILIGYWALLTFVPVRDISLEKQAITASLQQAGETDPHKLFNATSTYVRGGYEEGKNIVNHFDFKYLPLRKWDGNFDPEGILSTIPAVASCLLGMFAGMFLCDPKRTPQQKALGLAVAGVVLLAAGFGWGMFFPIIKKLWTSSFVLVAGGYSALLLAAFFWIIDVKGWQRWCQPFVWVGLNPITIYLAGRLIDFDELASRLAGGNVQELLDHLVAKGFGSLVVALLALGFVFGLARFLHQRKIYLRL